MHFTVRIKYRQIVVRSIDQRTGTASVFAQRQIAGKIHIIGKSDSLKDKYLAVFVIRPVRLIFHQFSIVRSCADGTVKRKTGNSEIIPEFHQIITGLFAETACLA